MNLEKLQQEAEELKSLDTSQITPEQLNVLVDKLATILDKSELFLSEININDIENETKNNDESE